MITTGIHAVDDALGGIRDGSDVCIIMEPGVEGTLFLINTFLSSLAAGQTCLLVIPHTRMEIFRQEIFSLTGTDCTEAEGELLVLDAADWDAIDGDLSYTPEKGARAWTARVEAICEERAVDAIFVYFNLFEGEFGFETARSIFSLETLEKRPTVVIEYLNMIGREHQEEIVASGDFDVVISVRAGFTYLPFLNYFTIEHVSWTHIPARSVPFVVEGARIIPTISKIVVTGPPNAGKSTFVRSASESGISVDRGSRTGQLTTVALDIGHLSCGGFDITLYGTPGQVRFDPIIPQLTRYAMGVIVVLDVTRPDLFSRAKELMDLVHASCLPLVVAANKVDLPYTVTDGQIREIIGIGEDVPIHFITAFDSEQTRTVVETLIGFILEFPF